MMHTLLPASHPAPYPMVDRPPPQAQYAVHPPAGYAWGAPDPHNPGYSAPHAQRGRPIDGAFTPLNVPYGFPPFATYGHPAQHYGGPPGFPQPTPQRCGYHNKGPLADIRVDRERPDLQQPTAPISNSPLPASARGPPSKPRQSGWAVWVGNLPPDTTVVHLRDHFSNGARADIESVFLIRKTNCAFVNYTTEKACLEAIHRFDCKPFRGHRLVCRMRRDSLNSARGKPEPPPSYLDMPALSHGSTSSSSENSPSSQDSPASPEDDMPLIVGGESKPSKPWPTKAQPDASNLTAMALENLSLRPKVRVRMFILKSLTLQDLLVSTRDGTWVTQPHNESKLNEAFDTAEDVYLVFSANKSGQYFGYARMESRIEDAGASLQTTGSSSPTTTSPSKANAAQQHGICADGESPRRIPMPATNIAPAGYILDDSARGTIFWEAAREDVPESPTSTATTDGGFSGSEGGRQFRVRWIATTQLPFHATRGLRNPLNSNREVKIARDGTELGTNVGTRLLQLFHHQPSPVSSKSMWD